jgi:hypothetical protein
MTALFDQVEAEYSERGTYVPNGAGALQAAITGAGAGDKILLASGDYVEEASITSGDLSIVGCGGATNNRPRLLAPAVQTLGRGIFAADIDDLTFQSIEIGPDTTCGTPPCPGNYSGDGIFVSAAIAWSSVTSSATAAAPRVTPSSRAEQRHPDRALHGARHRRRGHLRRPVPGIVVRHNDVRGSVAGTEFENCGNGKGYDNYAANNTGGMLVFLDGSLEIQVSDCHEVHHNLFENNNTTNYGAGTVSGIPDGTGLLVISNDSTPISYNILRGNNTFGLALVDEEAAGFDVSPVDPTLDYNFVFNNVITGNGTNRDTSPPNDSPVAADIVAIALDPGDQTGTAWT